MSTHFNVLKAKRKIWEHYQHKPWFVGCRTNTDDKEAHLELLVAADYTDRLTFITELEGVKIKTVVGKQTREEFMAMLKRSDECPKCGGRGWLWGHELTTYTDDDLGDNRYICYDCLEE